MNERYAIYYTPPRDSVLRRFGGTWLGYDPCDGRVQRPTDNFGLDVAFLDDLTAKPRLYGFHATLKPPFRLAEGRTQEALLDSVKALAASFVTFPLAGLTLRQLGSFLAVVPGAPDPRIGEIADACVAQLDDYRAPPQSDELERRRATGLSARQEERLQRWGYPYVFDEFRFHMTLTRGLEQEEREAVEPVLVHVLEPVLSEVPTVDALSVMRQADAHGPFTEVARMPLPPARA